MLVQFLMVCLMLVCLGCGSSGTGASMQGTITLDGQPISAGNITVMPMSGEGQPVGEKFSQGKYQLQSVPLGKVTVNIQASKETGETYDDNGTMRKKIVPIVPSQYAGGIEKEIVKGMNEIHFPLVSAGSK